MSIAELQNEITTDLFDELSSVDSIDQKVLEAKVKGAIREIKNRRSYPTHFTEADIEKDLESLYSNIRNLALYDFNQIGVEGQSSHSENSTSRNWKDREDCFKGIFAWAGI